MPSDIKYFNFIKLVLLFFLSTPVTAETLPIANFSATLLDGWENKEFNEKTDYRLSTSEDKTVLSAISQSSASGLVKKTKVDIKKYPYLNWSWKIDNHLDIENERIKAGDDFAARLYVVVSTGFMIWQKKVINYVWANNAVKEDVWENHYAGKRALMIAVRNKQDSTHTWFHEKRNIYEDLKQLFGKSFHYIHAVALMTDTDDSQTAAKSYYGDIYFSTD